MRPRRRLAYRCLAAVLRQLLICCLDAFEEVVVFNARRGNIRVRFLRKLEVAFANVLLTCRQWKAQNAVWRSIDVWAGAKRPPLTPYCGWACPQHRRA